MLEFIVNSDKFAAVISDKICLRSAPALGIEQQFVAAA
jgi:hypothetical protein